MRKKSNANTGLSEGIKPEITIDGIEYTNSMAINPKTGKPYGALGLFKKHIGQQDEKKEPGNSLVSPSK